MVLTPREVAFMKPRAIVILVILILLIATPFMFLIRYMLNWNTVDNAVTEEYEMVLKEFDTSLTSHFPKELTANLYDTLLYSTVEEGENVFSKFVALKLHAGAKTFFHREVNPLKRLAKYKINRDFQDSCAIRILPGKLNNYQTSVDTLAKSNTRCQNGRPVLSLDHLYDLFPSSYQNAESYIIDAGTSSSLKNSKQSVKYLPKNWEHGYAQGFTTYGTNSYCIWLIIW